MRDSLLKQVGLANQLLKNTTIMMARVEIKGPTQVTIKKRNTQYAKINLLGGELFILVSIYVGKTALIYVFKPVGATKYATMEMKVEECLEKLNYFVDPISLEESNLKEKSNLDPNAATLEQQERLADPLYSSW